MRDIRNISGDGLLVISYVGGTAILSRSAMAEMTAPMSWAAPVDNVRVTDTWGQEIS